LSFASRAGLLSPESADDKQNQRQKDAEQDRGAQGKVNDRVFAAPGEIPRQPAQGKMQAPGEDQQQAEDGQKRSREQQQFPQVRHNVFILLKISATTRPARERFWYFQFLPCRYKETEAGRAVLAIHE